MERARTRVVVANPADGGFLYWLVKLYLLGLCALLLLLVASLPTGYLLLASHAPPVPDLAAYRRDIATGSRIYAADGRLLSTLVRERRAVAELREVPPLLVKAFLAAEDRSFFSHKGVDFRGVLRAALVNLRSGSVRQGGSTITQQVAKSFLSPERTIERKLKELVLARRLETRYSKQEILFLYLNHIFLGAQAYGVKAAARVYFGASLAKLTVDEMAMLAGLVRAPSRYSPRRHPRRARQRRDQVLGQMRAAGFIDGATYRRAIARPLVLRTERERDPKRWLAPHVAEYIRRDLRRRYGDDRLYSAGWQVYATVDLDLQHLARARVRREVGALDKRQGWRGALINFRTQAERRRFLELTERMYRVDQLRTSRPYLALIERVRANGAEGHIGPRPISIPRTRMKWAAPYSRTNAENEQTIEDAREALKPGDVVWVSSPPRYLRGKGWGNPEQKVVTMSLDQRPRVEGAIYSYDHNTGYVLAMVGGLDYDRSTFNRTVQACRQPGSAYKPIYYSAALDSDEFSMGMILRDKPYQPEPGEQWNPQNVHGTLDGKVTMHFSLVKSLNLPSIQLLLKVGAKKAAAWARRLGFTTPIHADKALALGASCVKTDELTRAFATFARGGTQKDPVYIRQIRTRAGVVLEDHTHIEDPLLDEGDRLDRLWATSVDRPRRVIDPRTAFLMTRLLRDSVLHGIAARCRIVPAPTGGKGGTSSDTADTWFVGFTSQWTTTAWIGDDNYQRPLGAKEASYTTAIPLWANYMRDAVGKRPHHELPLQHPPGLKSAEIDFQTGGPAQPGHKKVRIWFRPGSWDPEDAAKAHNGQ